VRLLNRRERFGFFEPPIPNPILLLCIVIGHALVVDGGYTIR
jgi:hypothetical protein